MSYRVGIDVGGTFTDFLVIWATARRIVHKTSSTPADPSVGFATGLEEIAAQLGVDVAVVRRRRSSVIVHGTTVTTNAVLTRRGAHTGLLATEGLPRRARASATACARSRTTTACSRPSRSSRATCASASRARRLGGRRGHAARDRRRARGLRALPAEGVEAVAISFMHSPRTPAHERRARDLCRELLPDAYVTASSDLLPQVRYYDRTSTTVLNAYAGPIITRYLAALTERLAELGFDGVLLIMQSNGGVATPAEVAERAALSLLSGPASGPDRRALAARAARRRATASRSTWAARASTRRSSRTASRSS